MTENIAALVGAGTIGRGWAIVFARAGWTVRLWDEADGAVAGALSSIAASLADLAEGGLLDESPAAVAARIAGAASPGEAVAVASWVQESVREELAAKRTVFAELDRLAPAGAVLASSSSAIPASRFTEGLEGRSRCLIAHPFQPPFLLPAVELVPAPWTAPAVLERARAAMESLGQSPIVLAREIDGFVANRLQGALLREAYCLVRDGYATVEDVDRAVRDGPGRRWAITGPFENADLNWRGGVREHAARIGPAYRRMGNERGQDDPWDDALVAKVEAQRRAVMSDGGRPARAAWRDRRLAALTALLRRTGGR